MSKACLWFLRVKTILIARARNNHRSGGNMAKMSEIDHSGNGYSNLVNFAYQDWGILIHCGLGKFFYRTLFAQANSRSYIC